MIFDRYRDLFEDCPPVFWPWLWLQLAFLLALKDQDGRERLIMVSYWGKVIVLALGDDPNAPKGWCAEDLRPHLQGAGHWSRLAPRSHPRLPMACPWGPAPEVNTALVGTAGDGCHGHAVAKRSSVPQRTSDPPQPLPGAI